MLELANPPRDIREHTIRRVKKNHRWKLWAGLFSCLISWISAVTLYIFLCIPPAIYALEENGSETVGEVVFLCYNKNLRINGKHPLHIQYSFEDKQGNQYNGETDTFQRDFTANIEKNDKIAVLYNPDAPETNKIKGVTPIGLPYVVPLGVFLLGSIGMFLILKYFMSVSRSIDILTNGEVAKGTAAKGSILSYISDAARSKKNLYRIRYSYNDTFGEEHIATQWLSLNDVRDKLTNTTELTVLYLMEAPRKSLVAEVYFPPEHTGSGGAA
ncbi:MAG: DUF3592 domain-containing protein [Planctomycetota bacterium]